METSLKRAITAAMAGLAIVVATGAFAADCKPAVPDSDLLKPGTLTMSTNPTLPPLQFADSAGNLKGMRIELGNEIAKRLCLTPDYIRIEFSAMIPGLQAGRWDMINTGLSYNPDRAKIMYLVPYENQTIGISAPMSSTVSKLEDLNGKTVGVEIGGYEEKSIKKVDADLKAKGEPGMTVRTFDSFAIAYQALHAGQVDAVVSIDAVAKEYQDRGEFKRVISGLFPSPAALAFKNKPLAEAVAKVLTDLKADGFYDKLLTQYGLPLWDKPFAITGSSS
jgi:polar amino acid transport system substrate-binding protein